MHHFKICCQRVKLIYQNKLGKYESAMQAIIPEGILELDLIFLKFYKKRGVVRVQFNIKIEA